jgi:multicomponent Na+:H+ antiporter subunit D
MTNPWLILPIAIPMLTGASVLVTYRARWLQRALSVTGAAALLVVGVWLLLLVVRDGPQATQAGGWPAPYGITLVADTLSALLVALAGLVGFSVAVYSLVGIDPERESFGYHTLYHFLLMGVCGAFLTGDLFNLYVWFEVMLMASFVLLALGGERGQMEGAFKYVALNLLASAIFLATLGLLYGLAGTLNMADLAGKFATLTSESDALLTTLAVMFLAAFGIKAAVFPLFFWLPASYHTPPAPVAAVFAGLLTKVGVYALLRVFTLLFVHRVDYTHTLLLVVAGLTMLSGMLGALVQRDFRRVLSFNLVGHIGFMLMGLGLFSPLGLAGGIYYLVHDIVVKTNLFLISGVVEHRRGTGELARLGGLYRQRPGLAAAFLIGALSLAGVPPLSGFFAKLGLLQAGLAQGQYVLVGVALLASLLTLFSMLQLWNEAFWKPDPQPRISAAVQSQFPARAPTRVLVPVQLLAGLTVLLGLLAGPVFGVAQHAAAQLLDPSAYINVVMGGVP